MSIHVGGLVVEIVVSNDPLPWHYITRSPAVAEKGDRTIRHRHVACPCRSVAVSTISRVDWKCCTWKWWTNLQDMELQDMKLQDRKLQHMKMPDMKMQGMTDHTGGGVPVAPDRLCWASTSAWALSYSAVKLLSKNSNLFDHGTWSSQTDRQTILANKSPYLRNGAR